LQHHLRQGVVAPCETATGLSGHAQQPLHFRGAQTLEAGTPRRSAESHLGCERSGEFAVGVSPADKTAQGCFELAIDRCGLRTSSI
jgi:hypothetical protein